MRESGLPFEGRSATALTKVSCGSSDATRPLQASLARKASDAGSTTRVPLAEASVAIVVSTPHRGDAFAAGQWLIDTLKQDVPIWKREEWADGTTEWVHPS